MRKFSIEIYENLIILYSHYLSDKFIKEGELYNDFNWSRGFDKPAIKWIDGTCVWRLDNKWHRMGKPAIIYFDGSVSYWEMGESKKKVK